ncbi:type IV secretory system conjugative DNA transfer family protein [Streptomyces cinnamoneus]|nr:type IV secretory system conjugative DNA transfer family protein [Streptomyces cinnamoneus]
MGLTLLVWTATGLAALFAHGAWPDGVTLAHTPQALRRLATQPRDLPSAWPDAGREELSGYGLFWGLLVSEVLVAVVLTTFAIGTVVRWRGVRAREARRAREAAQGRPADSATGPATAEAAGAPGAAATTGVLEAAGMPETPRTAVAQVPETPQAPGTPGSLGASTAPPTPAVPTPAPYTRTTAQVPARAAAGPTAPPPAAATGPQAAPASGTAPRRLVYGTDRRPLATRAVLEAPGPALVVTSDPAVWADTKGARARLGPVHVFDPSHLLDTPDRLRWSPSSGCEARETAASRAAALLAPVRPPSALDSATADAAETLLRCWLHAAAVDGRPFRQVHRWAQGTSAHEPVRILRTNPKAVAGTAGELESALTGHPERRDMAQELTALALNALTSVHIRDACNPNRANSAALESFAAEGGTLYVVGEAIEDPRTRPGAMPLLTALTASVVEHGRRMAERSSSGRLDPPLTLVLEDVAAVAPLPALPELLADGEAQGLPTLALMRSEEQARARWPRRTLPASTSRS